MLCNDVQREDAKLSPSPASGLFCYIPLHKICYGIQQYEGIRGTQLGWTLAS